MNSKRSSPAPVVHLIQTQSGGPGHLIPRDAHDHDGPSRWEGYLCPKLAAINKHHFWSTTTQEESTSWSAHTEEFSPFIRTRYLLSGVDFLDTTPSGVNELHYNVIIGSSVMNSKNLQYNFPIRKTDV